MLNRRGMLLGTLSTPLLTGCFWPRFFDLKWDEEVLLHDGRVIVVTLKYTYERLGRSFSRYGPSILRRTELSFDAGPTIGRFSEAFDKHRVNIIEYHQGKWYLLLETRGAEVMIDTPRGREEAWGPKQNTAGQKCWSLDERGLTLASINDLPDEVLKVNVMMDSAPAEELAAFDGNRLTLQEKAAYLQKYPLDPLRMNIERPPASVQQSITGGRK